MTKVQTKTNTAQDRRRLKEARRPFIRRYRLSNMPLQQYKRRPPLLQQIKDVNSTSNNKMRQPQRLPWQRLRVAVDLGVAAAQAYMVFTQTVILMNEHLKH